MFISGDMKRRGGTLVRTNKEITTDERQLLLSMYINVLNYIPSQTDVFVFVAIWVQTCVCFVSVRHRKFFTQHKYCAIFNSSYTPLTSDVHIYNRSPHASKSNTHAKASWNRLPLAFELLDKKKQVLPLLAQAYWSSLWPQCTGWWVFNYWRQLVLTKPLFGNKWAPKLFPCKHYISNISNRVSCFCIWVCVNVF